MPDADRRPRRLSVCVRHAQPEPFFASGAAAARSSLVYEGWARARRVIAEFDPEVVVMFGPGRSDHLDEVVPAVAVALSATGRAQPDGTPGTFRVPTGLAQALVDGLIARQVDAVAAERATLDPGFGLAARDLLGGMSARATIPVRLGCAGPSPEAVAAAAAIGDAVGDALAHRPERVLFVGSSDRHAVPRRAAPGHAVSGPEVATSGERPTGVRLDPVDRRRSGPAHVAAERAATWIAARAAGGKPSATPG